MDYNYSSRILSKYVLTGMSPNEVNMKYLLFTLLLSMPVAASFNPDFEREDVSIKEHVFDDKYALMRAMKRKPYRKLFMTAGRKLQKHHGFSIWYVNRKGQPVGDCEVFYVKGDKKTRTHEINHCKYGNYHKGDH